MQRAKCTPIVSTAGESGCLKLTDGLKGPGLIEKERFPKAVKTALKCNKHLNYKGPCFNSSVFPQTRLGIRRWCGRNHSMPETVRPSRLRRAWRICGAA